jgi:hypothetical protein
MAWWWLSPTRVSYRAGECGGSKRRSMCRSVKIHPANLWKRVPAPESWYTRVHYDGHGCPVLSATRAGELNLDAGAAGQGADAHSGSHSRAPVTEKFG